MRLSNLWGFGKKQKIEKLELKLENIQAQRHKEKEDYIKELKEANDKCWIMLCEVSIAREERDKALKEIIKLKEEKKQLSVSKGGLTTRNKTLLNQVNELTKEVEELKKQLEESMTDKFRVKKIPEGRVPKKQTIRAKGSSVPSKIIKKIKED